MTLRPFPNLYWGQSAKVTVGPTLTNSFKFKKVVCQGCIFNFLIFNLYFEAIIKQAFEESQDRIKINDYLTNNIKYSDDTVLSASNKDELNNLIDRMQKTKEGYGIKVEPSKNQMEGNK